METQRTYIAIDLKSFYASVECILFLLSNLSLFPTIVNESNHTAYAIRGKYE